MEIFKKISIYFVFLLLFISCGKESGTLTSAKSNGPTSSTTYSEYNPPTGAIVGEGLSVAEGWSQPYYLAEPLNYSSTGGWLDSITISRNGKKIYFAYSRRNANEYLYNNGNEVIDGPAMTAENTTKYLQLFTADITSSGFNIAYSPANFSSTIDSASLSVNGTEDLMTYTAYSTGVQKIKLAQFSSGTWSQLGDLSTPVNGAAGVGCRDDNSFIIGNITSGEIYWESRRVNIAGTDCSNTSNKRKIYKATITSGSIGAAQLVSGLSTGTSDDYEPSFLEDKSKAYWVRVDGSSFGIYTADLSGATYINPRPIIYLNNFSPPYDNKIVDVGEPNVFEHSTGYVMYFRCVVALGTSGGNPSNRQLKFCVSKKSK